LYLDICLSIIVMEDTIVGIIGMGDMGKMYARRISEAGWK
jgi:prephenate dehydrogenase (NADP+)